MRHRYIDSHKLISEHYKGDEVYFRASNTQRTLESINSQLFGFYVPNGQCELSLNQYQQRRAVPPFKIEGVESRIEELGSSALPECYEVPPVFSRQKDYDFKLAIHHSECKAYNTASKERKSSKELEILRKPYTDALRGKFENFTGRQIDDEEIYRMCKYFSFGVFHELEFRVNITSQDLEN